jgi:hypothetical protein
MRSARFFGVATVMILSVVSFPALSITVGFEYSNGTYTTIPVPSLRIPGIAARDSD